MTQRSGRSGCGGPGAERREHRARVSASLRRVAVTRAGSIVPVNGSGACPRIRSVRRRRSRIGVVRATGCGSRWRSSPSCCWSPTTTIRATRIRTCSGSSTASPTISSPSSRRCTGRGRSGRSWSSPRLHSSAVAGGWLAISRSPGCSPRSWPGRWRSSSTNSRCRRPSTRSRASASLRSSRWCVSRSPPRWLPRRRRM